MLYYILLFVHLLLCGLVLLGILFGRLKVHKYMFFVALLMPFWGVLVLLILHFQIAFEADDAIDIDVEKLKLDSELYRSIVVDEKKVAVSTVPIEEALIINSARERRSIIMDVLNDNPKEYIEFLQKAGNNDDTEVVHYAVTAMVEISKENDHTLQQLERQYTASPDDPQVLTQYTDFLWTCLSQNLMQGQVEVMNRELFSSLMQKKLACGGLLQDYTRLIENELKRNNFTAASEAIEQLGRAFPQHEEYYLLKLKYFACLGRGKDIHNLIQDINHSNIYLSVKAKEALAFWET